jgi:hypothetical protein
MKARKASLIAAFALIWSAPLAAQPSYVPSNGFVPDAATAIAIARAVLIPIYGAKVIQAEELTAEQRGDIWVVVGTLQCPKGDSCQGGTAELQLSAKDGRILHVTHYQ